MDGQMDGGPNQSCPLTGMAAFGSTEIRKGNEIMKSTLLRRSQFVRDVETELQRRGYVKTGNLPGDLRWRRASSWFRDGLRVEIRNEHELRFLFNGQWSFTKAEDLAQAIKRIESTEQTRFTM
jgi:hypothetical protein